MHAHKHICGPGCHTALMLKRVAQRRILVSTEEIVAVKTWCRICGLPVLLEVLTDYEEAERYFCALDDHPMVHKSVHAEPGGWGVHWRLDEVLSVIFPNEHFEPIFPMNAWWFDRYGEPQAEDQAIVVLTPAELRSYQDKYMDMEIRMLDEQINRSPKSKEELEDMGEKVWGHEEVQREFEILGFRKPFAIAKHRETGMQGSLIFQNEPRYYFGWSPDRVI